MPIFVDISTTTPNKTTVKRGDYDLGKCKTATVNKEQGADTAVKRGYALEPVNTVTPNVYKVTGGKSAKAVVISALGFSYIPQNVNVTGDSYGNGEDIIALDEDVAIQAITSGDDIVVKLSGTGQPGDQVMTAAGGAFAKYDGSGVEYIKGVFKGLPGTQDGAVIKQGFTNGQLGLITFNGGA